MAHVFWRIYFWAGIQNYHLFQKTTADSTDSPYLQKRKKSILKVPMARNFFFAFSG